MKIFSAQQIAKIDAYTITNEPIASIDLMERASMAWTAQLFKSFQINPNSTFMVLCGPGNNGGDGLAVARLLSDKNYNVKVFRLACKNNESEEHLNNLERLPKTITVKDILLENEPSSAQFQEELQNSDFLVDAVFGSGLNRPISGAMSALTDAINKTDTTKIAVDIPSGMFSDEPTTGSVINCDHCFTFELPKLGLLLPQNNQYLKQWEVVNIGLHPAIKNELKSQNFYVEKSDTRKILKKRIKFSHKGINGHGLLIAGSKGKIGAAVLSSKAVLKSGCGLLDIHIPSIGYEIIQSSFPEAMVICDDASNFVSTLSQDLSKYSAVGIGPGMGQENESAAFIHSLIEKLDCPSVWDADALNILAKNSEWLEMLPTKSILTPHPGEFQRLVGKWNNDFERLEIQRKFAKKHDLIVILKGAYSSIALPNGKIYFNSTGNPGMATAGSGDVLTGILLGLLCQGYTSEEAAILGVYIHGCAGDLALEKESHESLIASDIISNLGPAFNLLRKSNNE